MWFVYILLCQDQSLYTGSTNNVEKRFRTHMAGHGGAYTRSHTPVKILYIERRSTKSGALRREAEIKKWPRKKKIKMLASHNKNHPGLPG